MANSGPNTNGSQLYKHSLFFSVTCLYIFISMISLRSNIFCFI